MENERRFADFNLLERITPTNVIKIKLGMISYFPSTTPSVFFLKYPFLKHWPADYKRAVETANSAVFGVLPYPWDTGGWGKANGIWRKNEQRPCKVI